MKLERLNKELCFILKKLFIGVEIIMLAGLSVYALLLIFMFTI